MALSNRGEKQLGIDIKEGRNLRKQRVNFLTLTVRTRSCQSVWKYCSSSAPQFAYLEYVIGLQTLVSSPAVTGMNERCNAENTICILENEGWLNDNDSGIDNSSHAISVAKSL